jgi:DUF4097 and DUF4098 domain-containing protein YvlB
MKRPVVIGLLVAALVLVCVGIGSVIYFANNFNINNPFDRQRIPSSLEESKTLEINAEETVELKVTTDAGHVTVTGGDVDTVQVQVIKTAYDSTQDRADEEVKTIKYTIEQNGNSIILKYEIPKSMNISNQINTVDFIVTVPNDSTADVDTSFGLVQVSGLNGSVIIENDFGDINISDVEGAVEVNSSSGEIELSSINAGTGDITVTTDFGKLSLEKVNGKDISINSNSGTLELNNVRATGELFAKSDFGNVDFENGSAANLELETNSGKITITKINVRNELIIDNDFGDIDLIQVTAVSYDLHTNSGTITIDGAKGKVKAYTDFGNIEIQNAVTVTLDVKTNSGSIEFSGSLGEGPHNVQSDFGNIDLVLPNDSNLNVKLTTDFGKITSDIPITVIVYGETGSDGGEIVGTTNDGGAQLIVHTNSGSITITAIK